MPETFQPGDRVRVIARDPGTNNGIRDTGEVTSLIGSDLARVDMDDGTKIIVTRSQIALLPPEPAEEPLFEGEFWFIKSINPEYGCEGFLYAPQSFKNNQGKGIRVRVTELRFSTDAGPDAGE